MYRSTSSGLNETFQTTLGKSEIVEEAEDDDLPTTAEVTRSDVSGEEDLVAPPKDTTSKIQSHIGGRKSYKTRDDACQEMSTGEKILPKSRETTPEISTSLLVSQTGRETTAEPSTSLLVSQAEIKEEEDKQSNIHTTEVLSEKTQNPSEADKTVNEQGDILGIGEETDYEMSEIPEDNTKRTEVTAIFENQIETDEEEEEEESGSEKENHESDDEIEEIVIEDEDSSSSRIHDEKTKSPQEDSDGTEDESKSSAVIRSSSSGDTTESSSSSSTGNYASLTSSPNTAKGSAKSEDTESDRDHEQLLYGDLDVRTVPLRSQSISSTETEVFIPSSSTDVEMVPCKDEQLESKEYMNEEKSSHFDLPSRKVTGNSSLKTSQESLDMSQRVLSTSMASVNVEEKDYASKINKRLAGPSPRGSLRSSDVSLTSASSNEEFFSPMHSHNNFPQKKMPTSRDKERDSDSEINVTKIVDILRNNDDNDPRRTKAHYESLKAEALRQSGLGRSEFDNLDENIRSQVEGYRAVLYVRLVFNNIPVECVANLATSYLILIGGLNMTEENIG